MKKHIVIGLLLSLVIACSNSPAQKYDLSKINSQKDFKILLEIMKKDNVKIDSTSNIEIVGQGLHFSSVPVKKITINEASDFYNYSIDILTDSTAYTGKNMLEQLETINGFGKYTEDFDDKRNFTWENEYRKIDLDLHFVDGKHLAAMAAKDYAELKISFPEQYNQPLAKVHHQVKKFDAEPNYQLVVDQYYTDASVFVDGVKRIAFGTLDTYGTNKVALNAYLFQRGKHQITIKVNHSKPNFSIKTYVKDLNTDEILVKKIDDDLPNFASKNNITFTLDFESKTPYTIKGWSEGKDLRNDKDIKDKVKTLYSKLGIAFLKKDKKTISAMYYDMAFEEMQTTYNNDYKESLKRWEELLLCTKNTYKYSVAQDFDIEVLDQKNGKLIYATPIGKSAMLITTGQRYSKSFDFYLYQPADSNELKIIR